VIVDMVVRVVVPVLVLVLVFVFVRHSANSLPASRPGQAGKRRRIHRASSGARR
jgi:hypothetical protein